MAGFEATDCKLQYTLQAAGQSDQKSRFDIMQHRAITDPDLRPTGYKRKRKERKRGRER